MKNFAIKLDRTLDDLNGRVKSVFLLSKRIKRKEGSLEFSDARFALYNWTGNKALKINYDEYGEVNSIQRPYISGGKRVNYKSYNSDKVCDFNTEYLYSESGQLVQKNENGVIVEVYSYDNRGNIIEVFFPRINSVNIYKYDSSNFVVQQTSGEIERKGGTMSDPISQALLSLLGGAPSNQLFIYNNDKIGNVVEMQVFNNDNNSLFGTKKFIYNSMGFVIEAIERKNDGAIKSHVKYDYEFDDKGNWISKKEHTTNGTVFCITTRLIEYHPPIFGSFKKDLYHLTQRNFDNPPAFPFQKLY